MVRHYDMASCEQILDPQTDKPMTAAQTTPPGEVSLRLQTLEEARALEAGTKSGMPADLLLVNPVTFIDAQS